jgi:putative SOS response-associated peptidase YedK
MRSADTLFLEMARETPNLSSGVPKPTARLRRRSAYEHQAKPQQFRLDPATGEPVESQLRWGLIHHSEKAWPAIQPINARAETLLEKPLFADAYYKRRCIVPMSQFYLKDKSDKRRSIARVDRQLFGVAGIWENWDDPDTGEWLRTFATITVAANALIAPIHDRMPAILENEEFRWWLAPQGDPYDLLRPYSGDDLILL